MFLFYLYLRILMSNSYSDMNAFRFFFLLVKCFVKSSQQMTLSSFIILICINKIITKNYLILQSFLIYCLNHWTCCNSRILKKYVFFKVFFFQIIAFSIKKKQHQKLANRKHTRLYENIFQNNTGNFLSSLLNKCQIKMLTLCTWAMRGSSQPCVTSIWESRKVNRLARASLK